MFDIGGWEFLLIAIFGIIIIGPKELPGAIRTVSMFVRRARGLAREFQSGLEEVAREAELDGITDGIKDIGNPASSIRERIQNTIDPENKISDAMDFDPDWRDDDLTDYVDEFGDENKMLAPDKESEKAAAENAAESDAPVAAESTAQPEEGDAADPVADTGDGEATPDKKPDAAV